MKTPTEHRNYFTNISNKEDEVYLRTVHFPVNMRLFKTSEDYKDIILSQCNYIRKRCLTKLNGYKKPHGMSSANLGLSHNIIGVTLNRNTKKEYCLIMINPSIVWESKEDVITKSNCGSIVLDTPINVRRKSIVTVSYYTEKGEHRVNNFDRKLGGFSIQHEIDHNNGILIIDKEIKLTKI